MEPDSTNKLKREIYNIIFEAETPKGRAFDVALIICILLSIGVIMLESVTPIKEKIIKGNVFDHVWIIKINCF